MIFREFELGSKEYHEALQLRAAVLRTPLGLTWTEAELADEPHCYHLGAFEGERLVAVLLLKPLSKEKMKMRQVAVHFDFQGRGAGAQLVAFAEEFSRARNCRSLVAHARESAVGFYQKIGYSVSSDPFIENTIPHRLVMKEVGL
ncbi:MAG: hypothetical protein QOE70_4723 [Chthoniobacter sp.]|nr:hypothetical protein [Chthoniobacter sp.]